MPIIFRFILLFMWHVIFYLVCFFCPIHSMLQFTHTVNRFYQALLFIQQQKKLKIKNFTTVNIKSFATSYYAFVLLIKKRNNIFSINFWMEKNGKHSPFQWALLISHTCIKQNTQLKSIKEREKLLVSRHCQRIVFFFFVAFYWLNRDKNVKRMKTMWIVNDSVRRKRKQKLNWTEQNKKKAFCSLLETERTKKENEKQQQQQQR